MATPAVEPRRWLQQWAWVTLSLSLAASLLSLGNWTWRADQALYDLSLTLFGRPTPDDVVIIRIDDQSIQALGRWPWPRSVHATLIEQLGTAAPKSILLNLLLSEPSEDPRQDDVLAQAMARSGRVVLPVSPSALTAGESLPTATEGAGALLPLPALRAQAVLGHSDVDIDPDGVVRSMHLKAGPVLASHPHLALAMLQAAGERPITGLDIQRAPSQSAPLPIGWQRDERAHLRYGGPHRWVPSVSYASVLRGDVPLAMFQRKHVLIGVTALGLGHQFNTPVSSLHGPMSGVEITAQALHMLRQGPVIHSTSPAWSALWTGLLTIALMWGIWRLPPRQGLLLGLGAAASATLLSMLALGLLGWWWAPGSFVVAALLCYPFWSWRRLELSQQYMARTVDQINEALPPDEVPGHALRKGGDATKRSIDAASDATQRLQHARQSLSDILSVLPVSVIVVDQDLVVQALNPLAGALLRADAEHRLLGHGVIHALHGFKPVDATNWASLFQKAIVGQTEVVSEVQGPDMSHLWMRVTPFQERDQAHAGLMISMTDVSQLRLAEQQRDDLLAFIAHDIRSPQSSLLSMVEMHRMGYQAMPLDTLMTHVDNLARNTIGLCEDLLMVMKSESQPLSLSLVDLREVVQQALDEVTLQAQARHIELQMVQTSSGQAMVRGDAVQIRRALINLMNNAIKFSPAESVVQVEISHDEAFARVAIADQGPGIPSSDLGKLFRRYQRLESGQHLRVSAGVGLGLVFVDTVARRHGGQIEVTSTPGQGSCFTLSLPVDMSAPAA